MRSDLPLAECSFTRWYPKFSKNAIESVTLPLPDEILKYLEHDAFLLPLEAAKCDNSNRGTEWCDGSAVDEDEESEEQPTFPHFSKLIQETLDEFGAVFIKSNWSSPLDAIWVATTKTLKCTVLEDIYLLLKSSDRISGDLAALKNHADILQPCLVLKRWRDIDPCTEFRCFVRNKILVAICQRDISQYYMHIENEKYNIKSDINSLFLEKIKHKFDLDDYTFDVTRYTKDRVKILDFGPLNESVTKDTLFSLEEIQALEVQTPEFRFIAEDMGIQPKPIRHYCIPQEINEFFQGSDSISIVDALKKEVEDQKVEEDSKKR